MKRKNFALIETLCILTLSVGVVTPARAGNLNTSATSCMNKGGPQRDLMHTPSGVRAQPSVPMVNIICSIPRTPVRPGIPVAIFNVTGGNDGGATIECGVFAYSVRGVLLTSGSFSISSETPGRFVQQVILPDDQVGIGYTTLDCRLTPGGEISSVIAMF